MKGGTSIVRVARYHRVSRTDQSTNIQEDGTAEYARCRSWVVAATYIDEGISGAEARRPGLDRMLADARRGRFNFILVWKSDRLFRSLRDMIVTIDDLAAMNIGFASCTEPFDTSIPSGRLLWQVVGALGEFERDLLRERVRAGVEAARRRGRCPGRPRARLDMDRALQLRAMGKTVREVASDLGVGQATLYRALAASKALSNSPPVIPSAAA